ncbi:putative CAS/CSE/importin domain protein [Leptomonas pyrrhocoris]|uniref:Putative CAS/CSE/importin domain protein n=1 Tax=Leptomonas pyrrhocoris TaxID=157538 RepID=A0A0M9G6K8_LEPPY|nr:putative CAS/CSE/importin domain protein [Leptomonas pyrrhocoris]XP_015661922.1 putative CAS/CSE/importin domain protein [Leptomonas pyrrhocoris]KPA83482.1 putative CAS/CSE/importin domain protein [Leptomonas pyrrhocoris]KPA83483.1 putative CAS/CSE/importin domain protein [Leptomonas pyrrhocoris]|eukprot:XP_015661921.1 putative CAS/CSE/importin domain protein [Leptomonas pyrrhocoris]
MQPIDPDDPRLVSIFVAVAEKASSVNSVDRDQAEQEIKKYQNSVDQQRGFVQLLLHLATNGHPTSAFYAIVLKNTVKLCWNPSMAEHCIQEDDKAAVREVIIRLMLQSPPAIQRNMAETIALIADVDFPTRWPNALALIVEVLNTAHSVAVQCAALSTAHSILRKYRMQGDFTETFVAELRTVYTVLFPTLMHSIHTLLSMVAANQPGTEIATCVKGVTAAVECVRDMTSLDLGDELIAQKKAMMDVFLQCLSLPLPVGGAACAQATATIIALKSAVTACVTHLLNAFDEDFEAYAPQFLSVVWALIADPSSRTAEMDDLVVCSIELLSGACRGTSRPYFDDVDKLRELVHNIILPNLAVNDEDLELYLYDPDAYIQKDIEGSDLHTRRRAAGELVRTLVTHLPDKMRPLISAETKALFETASSDWKAKDTAIYLASSLALEGQHVDAQRGAAAQQLSNLISFDDFLSSLVIPELTSGVSVNSPAIIKADCIRVIAVFRYHIAPSLYANLISVLAEWVKTDDHVIMSYAAHTLERLLCVQREQGYVATEAVFQPQTAAVLQTLCTRIQSTEQPNQFLMQCLMRVCFRFPQAVAPLAGAVVESLNQVLHRAARNPSNPLFSHCLFETISKCIAMRPEQGTAMEGLLWDNLIYVLAQDVVEYVPYVLQILSQLLRTHQPPCDTPPAHFPSLLDPLTQPGIYENKGNVPAVVCLLCAFIELYPSYVHSRNLTNPILNIFAYLVRLKNYDHEGLNIITAVLLAYPPDVMAIYVDNVLRVLLDRLSNARTPKFVRILILFLSVYVVVRGAHDLVSRMNNLKPGLFMQLLGNVWLPHMQKITGEVERKTCVVALAKVLCDCEELQADTKAWTTSVFSCLKMIHAGAEQDDYTSFAPKAGTLQDLTQLPGNSADAAVNSVFCPLQEAAPKPRDVCADVANADRYFRDHMMELLRGRGQSLVGPLQATLTPDLLALIQ